MNEVELLARIGRMTLQAEVQNLAYDQLLALLGRVVSGEVHPSRVLVNLTDRGWTQAPEGMRPELPATFNGRPVCIVAPVEAPAAELPAEHPAGT